MRSLRDAFNAGFDAGYEGDLPRSSTAYEVKRDHAWVRANGRVPDRSEFWECVIRLADEVEQWPEWKRRGM